MKSLMGAEKINIKFEDMSIPISIEQLSKLETYDNDSTELIEWFQNNRLSKIFELYKYLEYPVFKEVGLTKQVLRSWMGRKLITELSKTIIVPEDIDGLELFNTIENLLEAKKEVSTLDILKAIPNKEIELDLDNLLLILSSWKEEISKQQNLILKLKDLNKTENMELLNLLENSNESIEPFIFNLYVDHREKPLSLEIWESKTNISKKNLIIFMPGLGGDIGNFRWLGSELSKRGWPIIFINHEGSNSESLKQSIKDDTALPGAADIYLYRIKDLDAVIKAHNDRSFGLDNESYVLMGHSLGSLISFLYAANEPEYGLQKRCNKELIDFALTNLSKLIQCQLSEITLPQFNNQLENLTAIVGFNSFGSLIWPNVNSSGIEQPVLLIGGTYDLITPLINEQFKLFLSTTNPLNRFLVVEGASHFSPIKLNNKSIIDKSDDDIFKIKDEFIGLNPNQFQDLSLKFIIEFLTALETNKEISVQRKQTNNNINYHLLNYLEIKKILGN